MSGKLKNSMILPNYSGNTPTFRKIMDKYNQSNITLQKDDNNIFLRKVESKIQKLQKEETEYDFIKKEVKRNYLINQEIRDSFGLKSLHHYDEVQKIDFPEKVERESFKPKNKKRELYQLTSLNNSKEKILKLPQIYIRNNSNNKTKNKIQLRSHSINGKESKKNYSQFYKNKLSSLNLESKNNKSFKKNHLILNKDYLDYINYIKCDAFSEKKNIESFCYNHKLVCTDFKSKYEYLKNKFFL